MIMNSRDTEVLLSLEGFCSANTWERFVNVMSSTTMMILVWILTLLGGSFGIGAYENWDGLRCVYFAIVSGKYVWQFIILSYKHNFSHENNCFTSNFLIFKIQKKWFRWQCGVPKYILVPLLNLLENMKYPGGGGTKIKSNLFLYLFEEVLLVLVILRLKLKKER